MRVAILLPSLLLSACFASAGNAAEPKTIPFALQGFSRVSLEGPDDIRVTSGQAFSVLATGPAESLERLDLRVENGVLKVRRKKDGGWDYRAKKPKVRVDVAMPEIDGAILAGGGNFKIRNAGASSAFEARLSGSGDLNVDGLHAETVTISLSGAGDVTLAGTAQSLKASVSGSGNVNARALPVRIAQLSVAGVGNIETRVSDRAVGALSGVGNIDVMGGAACAIRRRGVGSVRCGGQQD